MVAGGVRHVGVLVERFFDRHSKGLSVKMSHRFAAKQDGWRL